METLTLRRVPEGDTIHRAAARLRPALVGAPLERLVLARAAVGTRPRPGTPIDAVDAVGKHLLVRFADGHVLRTHLRMSGSWHLYRAGERWQRPAHLARVVVAVPEWEAVCFAAPVVELTLEPVPPGEAPASVAAVAHLGPDLCDLELDVEAVVGGALERMAALPEPTTSIDEVLLDQRVAAGIGNVYKSEALWACRVHPFVPLRGVDESTRRALLTTAARQLRANLGGGPRTTRPGPPGTLAVYGRARRPCPRCGTPIRRDRRGALARSTYWCPRCQPPDAQEGTTGPAG